jgi:hypothetical protein
MTDSQIIAKAEAERQRLHDALLARRAEHLAALDAAKVLGHEAMLLSLDLLNVEAFLKQALLYAGIDENAPETAQAGEDAASSPAPSSEPLGPGHSDPLRSGAATRKDAETVAPEEGGDSATLALPALNEPSSTAARKDVPGKTTVRDALAQIGDDPVKAAQPPVSEGAAFASTGDSIRKRVPEVNDPAGTQAPPVEAKKPWERGTLRDRVEALNAERPTLTIREAADELGCSYHSVYDHSRQLKLSWGPKSESLRQRIGDLHARTPGLSAEEAAKELGCSVGGLRGMSSRLQIRWGRSTPAPPTPKPVRLQNLTPVKVPGNVVMRKPRSPPRKATRFMLVNPLSGLYLHQSCELLTAQKHYAWSGRQDQLLEVRKRYPIARDLAERVVEEETSHVAA